MPALSPSMWPVSHHPTWRSRSRTMRTDQTPRTHLSVQAALDAAQGRRHGAAHEEARPLRE